MRSNSRFANYSSEMAKRGRDLSATSLAGPGTARPTLARALFLGQRSGAFVGSTTAAARATSPPRRRLWPKARSIRRRVDARRAHAEGRRRSIPWEAAARHSWREHLRSRQIRGGYNLMKIRSESTPPSPLPELSRRWRNRIVGHGEEDAAQLFRKPLLRSPTRSGETGF